VDEAGLVQKKGEKGAEAAVWVAVVAIAIFLRRADPLVEDVARDSEEALIVVAVVPRKGTGLKRKSKKVVGSLQREIVEDVAEGTVEAGVVGAEDTVTEVNVLARITRLVGTASSTATVELEGALR